MPRLVLSRMTGESLLVGEDIKITVTFAGGGKARLAVEAPEHVRVDRLELRQRKDAEFAKEKAAEGAGGHG